MTLEELKALRERAAWNTMEEELGLGPIADLAEGMLKLAEIAERDHAIVGVYRETWKEDGLWVADADKGLSTLGEASSDDLLDAIDALYDELSPSHSSPTGDSAP